MSYNVARQAQPKISRNRIHHNLNLNQGISFRKQNLRTQNNESVLRWSVPVSIHHKDSKDGSKQSTGLKYWHKNNRCIVYLGRGKYLVYCKCKWIVFDLRNIYQIIHEKIGTTMITLLYESSSCFRFFSIFDIPEPISTSEDPAGVSWLLLPLACFQCKNL